MFAQLRDVLAAEDSTVVPEEDDDRGTGGPKQVELDRTLIGVRKDDPYKAFCVAGHGQRL
jgi:hypothetical protein